MNIESRSVAREFVGGLKNARTREGNKNDTVGCIPTRWDGLSLQDSRETPVVVPGARRRARICRISRWIFCKRSVRTRITRYTGALRPPFHCYNVHTIHFGRYSITVKFRDKLPRGRGSVARRGIEGFREKNDSILPIITVFSCKISEWIEKIDE